MTKENKNLFIKEMKQVKEMVDNLIYAASNDKTFPINEDFKTINKIAPLIGNAGMFMLRGLTKKNQ